MPAAKQNDRAMYLKPLTIGSVLLPHNIIFGPMAGVSDLPFRLLCHEQGAALSVTELISAKAITYRNKNTQAMLEAHPDEGFLSVQLFGHEPEVFAQAIRMMRESSSRHDILDINMGCPVPKVVSNGEGSALMKNPALIEDIVRACVKAEEDTGIADATGNASAPRPVTVKLRSGFDTGHINAVDCALAAETGGASAVALHARTRDQMYGGKADWHVIRAVKEAVRIPVIGNGDVTDGESARRMLEETGCDGVMVARGAQGNPWVFRVIIQFLESGEVPARPTGEEICRMVLRHLELLMQYKGEYVAVREMRTHLAHYTKGMPGASRMREQFNRIGNAREMREMCKQYLRPFSGIYTGGEIL